MLLTILADGQFHSGPQIAQQLGLSRAAVQKNAEALGKKHISLIAIKGRGYRLPAPIDWLNHEAITEVLTPDVQRLVSRLDIHDILPSTNSWIFQAPLSEIVPGWVCLAEMQTAGRGRRGRSWISPFGGNIYLSVGWQFDQMGHLAGGLSLAVGVALVRALRRFGVPEAVLKWPNDVLWREQKLAGILVEGKGEPGGPFSIVAGMGINVRMPVTDAQRIDQPWVDLTTASQTDRINRNVLVGAVLNELLPLFVGLSRQGVAAALPAWRALHGFVGRTATVVLGEEHIRGVIVGVDEHGQLLLDTVEGRRSFASGEVQLRTEPADA